MNTRTLISYPLLRPHMPLPVDTDLSGFLKLGWTHSDIAALCNTPDPTESIHERLKSAAGRLICRPDFVKARDSLRRIWEDLPLKWQPPLPMRRSIRVSIDVEPVVKPLPPRVGKFIAEFDNFCDEWHLNGMTDWDLPDVRGPNWVPELATPEIELQTGAMGVVTPWHFPVLSSDGLGPLLEAEHRRQAAERGIDDVAHYPTYAKLFAIDYWERVLRGRYTPQKRVRAFVTHMEPVLAEIANLGTQRVQKLRKLLSNLRSGKRKTLRGWH